MNVYDFKSKKIPDHFYWFNEPEKFFFEQGLNLITKPNTDFWQGTHYGFRRDDGHCLLINLTGNFSIKTQVEFYPTAQYDQCGLFGRLDQNNWIKCSVELENAEVSRLGSVVTNRGYSDWATQDISSNLNSIYFRISKEGNDFLLEHSLDDIRWYQMRITHLHEYKDRIDVGIYACSPLGEGFRCNFRFLEIGENMWHYNHIVESI